ncbi:MAG: Glu/Leu/Phe/Val dehydrogenase [Thermofilaceae archaeon]|nr:Glu/Leu/Phe/Val dehydrogenase [Thermofilaceae archaeon]MCX8181446.1 Glu/Leu/Phe/Val dehydrogenase [Thermofilaceae archaeon]
MGGASSILLKTVLTTLQKGFELGKFPDSFYKILSKPERVVAVSLPVRLSDGRIEVFEGFRVQHSSVLGPYKGGIRFHPEVTLEDDIALAMLMTLKNSLAGLPYGGGKGAVRVNPKALSKRELEELSRVYVRALYPVLGEQVDIPGPDVGTDPQVMAWMVDEYSRLRGFFCPAAFTAKPVELGGNPVREYATGFGCAVVTKVVAEELFGSSKGLTLSIQGFGNVGLWHAYWAWKMGFKVVALSDSKGTVYDPEGINVEKAIEVKKETGTVVEYPGKGQSRDVKETLYVEADIVAPDALENQLTAENAHLVKARIVVEGANGPTTPEAEQILAEKGVVVVPDMLANAGGVAASYFEWVQNIQRLSWSEEDTRAKLAELMETNFKRVLSQWRKLQPEHKRVTLRDAAVVTSLQRIYNAMISRGWL